MNKGLRGFGVYREFRETSRSCLAGFRVSVDMGTTLRGLRKTGGFRV